MSADTKQTLGSILTFVGTSIGFTPVGVILDVAGAALLYSGGRQAAKDAQAEARLRSQREQNSREVKSNVRGSSEVHYVCFGKVRVGGIIVAIGQGAGVSGVLYVGVAHSLAHAGGCEGIGRIWINDDEIATGEISGDPLTTDANVTNSRYVYTSGAPTYAVHFRHYRGTATQTADTTLTNFAILGGGSTAYRRGIAWTRFTLERNGTDLEGFDRAFSSGIPNLSVELKGNRVYDPRLDTTNGGSGSHRYSDPTTWEWTSGGSEIGRNPALAAATYMIMEVSDGGMGHDPATIDWDYVASAANICDESITVEVGSPTVTQVRYTCDIALDTSQSRGDNLQKLLDTMQGACVRIGNKYRLYAGAYRSPTFALDATYLRGGVKIATRSPLEQLYNAVRVIHDDAEQQYRAVEAPPFTSSAYETQDGGERLWREETLEGVSNTYRAQYIASVLGQMSRKQKTIEVPCNYKALDLECWEVGTVTLPELGINGDTYRVIAWEWTADGPTVTLREETSAVWDVPGFVASTTSTAGLQYETPDAPANLTATVVTDGVSLKWDAPSPADARQVDIYRAGSGSPQTFTLVGSSSSYQFVDPIGDGAQYVYRAKRVNIHGQESTWSSEVTVTTRTVPNVVSPGSGTPVYSDFNTTDNQHELNALVAGNLIDLTVDEATKVITIDSLATEQGHLGLSSGASSTSTTLADVSGFKFTLEPNKKYKVQLKGLVQTAATTTGFKIGATAPSGTSLMTLRVTAPDTAASTTGFNGFASGTTSVSVTTANMPAATTTYPFEAEFNIQTGDETGSPTTGFVGDFQIQWATEVAASSATLVAGSNMVLSEISTMTPTATLTIATDPGLAASYDSSESGVDTVRAFLTVTCLADGTWAAAAGFGDTLTGTPTSGNWATPTTPGAGPSYECKFTDSSFNGIGTVTNPAPDWTQINSDLTFKLLVVAGAGTTKTGTLNLQMQVRERGTTSPVSNDTTAISVSASST